MVMVGKCYQSLDFLAFGASGFFYSLFLVRNFGI